MKNQVKIHNIIFIISMFAMVSLQAQVLQMLRRQPTNTANGRVEKSSDSIYVTLPFFDDFAKPNQDFSPSSRNWSFLGNTYVNNAFAINAPNFNVVTFNGANSSGFPYNSVASTTPSRTDSLVSNYFDLSALKEDSNVYLSFYIQAGGKIDQPEPKYGDTLYLKFLNQSSVWTTVWKSDSSLAANSDSSFKQVFVKLDSRVKNVFHKNFRFKFVAVGSTGGSFDAWHIDYVYLNKYRSPADTFLYDRTFSGNVAPFLKQYTAMPWDHFNNKEVRNEYPVTYKVKYNFGVNTQDPVNISFKINDDKGNELFKKGFLNDFTTIVNSSKRMVYDSIYLNKEGYDSTDILAPTKRIISIYQADQADKQLQPFVTFNPIADTVTLHNDTIQSTTIFDNYFAYDDGTPEYAYHLPIKYGRVAYKFWVNKPDTLSAINMQFVNNYELNNANFKLYVWKELFEVQNQNVVDGTKDVVLYKKDTVAYTPSNGGFSNYSIDSMIIVKDTFYIGYYQTENRFLHLGYDCNEYIQTNHFLYADEGGTWKPFKLRNGNLMMRPYFGAKKSSLARSSKESFDVILSPNPTNAEVTLTGVVPDRVEIFDITGKKISEDHYSHQGLSKFNISGLPSGIYFFSITKSGVTIVKRVFLMKN